MTRIIGQRIKPRRTHGPDRRVAKECLAEFREQLRRNSNPQICQACGYSTSNCKCTEL